MSGYRNRFEARCARDLGPDYQYEAIKLTYTVEHTYLADFVNRDGNVIIEAKGYFPAEDRRKMIAVKKANPQYSYELWFSDPSKTISKTSKTTYREWAERHGFIVKQGPAK